MGCPDVSDCFLLSKLHHNTRPFRYQIEYVNSDIIDANCDNLKTGEVGFLLCIFRSSCSLILTKVLCLGIKGQDCKATYIVQAGDTCDDIVKSKGITLATLLANNPNTGSDCFISTGEVMKIPLLVALTGD
jgi:hypothetical protein